MGNSELCEMFRIVYEIVYSSVKYLYRNCRNFLANKLTNLATLVVELSSYIL